MSSFCRCARITPSRGSRPIVSLINIMVLIKSSRIARTCVIEPQFRMTQHPFFGNCNKVVNRAMMLSKLDGANKARRKVDI